MYNLLGKKVISKTPNNNTFSLTTHFLPTGIYIVKLTTETRSSSYKIVKE